MVSIKLLNLKILIHCLPDKVAAISKMKKKQGKFVYSRKVLDPPKPADLVLKIDYVMLCLFLGDFLADSSRIRILQAHCHFVSHTRNVCTAEQPVL